MEDRMEDVIEIDEDGKVHSRGRSQIHGDATLAGDLTSLLNRYRQENPSNTPDWILAQFLISCLAAWNQAVQQRETWYGRDARPSSPGALAAPSPAPQEKP